MKNFKESVQVRCMQLPNTAIMKTPVSHSLILCCNSMFVLLELLDDKDIPDADTTHSLLRIDRARGISLAVKPNNWDKAFELLMEIATSDIETPKFELRH